MIQLLIGWVVSSVILGVYLAFRWRNRPPTPTPTGEPDVITRLAAIGDPKSEAAQQVRDWEAWIKYRDVMLKRVAAATSSVARAAARADFLGRKSAQ